MLNNILWLFRNKELATENHATSKERNRTCFVESQTSTERISLKAFPVKSLCSLSITYQKNRRFRNGDLDGHIFPIPLRRPEGKLQVLNREIPKLFLVSEEIFLDHITLVLSETCLSGSIQKRLLSYISKLKSVKTMSYRRGFRIEVDIKVEADNMVQIGCGCKGREACPWREVSDRHVTTRLAGTDCPICLTELSGAVCRMELRCSHVFHRNCVMKWLENNTSCPICRAEAIGEAASIY